MLEKIEIGKRSSLPLLIISAADGVASTGSIYQKLMVKDIEGSKASMYNFGKGVSEKDIISAVVEAVDYSGKKSFHLKDWNQADEGITATDFLPKAEIDIKATWKMVANMIKTITNTNLCKLVCKVLWNDNNTFRTSPLSATERYARIGGVLEATAKLMELSEATANIMNLDRNIMVAASAVYYIGNIEMTDAEFAPTANVVLTTPAIITHDKLILAEHMLAENEMVDPETFKILDNIILSGTYDQYGATLEAKVIQMLSRIVMKVDAGNRIMNGLESGAFLDTYKQPWYKRKESLNTETALKEETA